MSKTRGNKLPWDARAAEVIAGRMKLDATDLIALVNEVNPTGRGRDAKESAARYALKARLASLLVTRFPDVIEVAPEPEHEGVVSIRHRSHRQSACHAVLDALDEDARSWVQREIDLGGGPESEEAKAGRAPAAASRDEEDDEPTDPDEMLAAAVRAEEAFDYDKARRLFEGAFHGRKDARSAAALVRFLVDAMAADADALALDDELPPAARALPGVRVLLGIAAARSGDDARAVGYLTRVEDPRAAEGLAIVAQGALARGDVDEAALRLHEAEAADPAHPALRALAEDLGKQREALRAPHEAELASLLGAGRDVEAAAKAEAILARWPDSEAARRAARALALRRQTEEGRRLIAEAEAARGRGEIATALGLFRRAIAAPLDEAERARARRAVDVIEAEEQEREAARRVERTAAALDHHEKQERARALAAYVDLDEAEKVRVRARTSLAALGWMDAMIRAGARPKIAVEATLALERAAEVAETAEPAVILGLLAPHERALEGVPFARRLADQARGRAAEERLRRAVDEITAAEEALAAGDLDESRKLLDHAGRELGGHDGGHPHTPGHDGGPPPTLVEARARAEALGTRLNARAARDRLEKRFERARASNRYADARRCAEELSASLEEPDRGRWLAVARSLVDEVRRERRVRVYDLDGGPELSHGSFFFHFPPAVPMCVDLRRGVVLLPGVMGSELFVRSFALDTGRMVRCVHLAAPDRLDEPRLEMSGDSALVMGGGNGVLEISLATADPLRWSVFPHPSQPEQRFSYVVLPVPGSYQWVVHMGDFEEGHVHDRDGDRLARDIVDASAFVPLPGVIPPRIAVMRGESILSIHEPGGIQTARLEFPSSVEAVAPHPSGEGLVVVFSTHLGIKGGTMVQWAEVSPGGERTAVGVVEGAKVAPQVAMASARDTGMVFIDWRDHETNQRMLSALAREPGTDRLRAAYTVTFGQRRMLVQDPEGRRVYAVGEHDSGLEVIELGPEPPPFAALSSAEGVVFPLRGLRDCMAPRGVRQWKPTQHFVDSFKWIPRAETRERLLALRAAREGDREALVDLFWGAALSYDPACPVELAAWLVERYPDDPEVVQASWTALAVERRWEAIIARLDPIDPASLPNGARKHRHHLLAAACFNVGELERGRRHLEVAGDLEGPCDLAPLTAYGAVLAEERPMDEVPVDLPPLPQLLAIARAADARLARGDHDGVIALFERALVWELDEVQSLARLAAAHLARPARTDAERLRKSLALAKVAALPNENRLSFRQEVIVPGAMWPDDRIAAIIAEASAWLGATGA